MGWRLNRVWCGFNNTGTHQNYRRFYCVSKARVFLCVPGYIRRSMHEVRHELFDTAVVAFFAAHVFLARRAGYCGKVNRGRRPLPLLLSGAASLSPRGGRSTRPVIATAAVPLLHGTFKKHQTGLHARLLAFFYPFFGRPAARPPNPTAFLNTSFVRQPRLTRMARDAVMFCLRVCVFVFRRQKSRSCTAGGGWWRSTWRVSWRGRARCRSWCTCPRRRWLRSTPCRRR